MTCSLKLVEPILTFGLGPATAAGAGEAAGEGDAAAGDGEGDGDGDGEGDAAGDGAVVGLASAFAVGEGCAAGAHAAATKRRTAGTRAAIERSLNRDETIESPIITDLNPAIRWFAEGPLASCVL